ncbi:B3 domain-containing protein At3g18960-like [Vicia villosa]|uniref:B3 domain-containing protein At3g18960-like n=1 Tax=Vicia villosa TaxID=3911 RepID=UPI00273A97A2|nr:B3 domain-containing protein At3g18960-like [Vicia villosa]
MATEYPKANKPIQFFRVIVTENPSHGKLVKPCMLRIKFVKKYGQGLAKVICLKTSNGENWKINLVINHGKIWFGKGWKEFAQYYFLGHGHFLVFKYQRHSKFHVDIFDNKSTLEIDYPPIRVEAEKVSENNEDFRTSKKRKANSSFEFGSTGCAKHHTHKRSKESSQQNDEATQG